MRRICSYLDRLRGRKLEIFGVVCLLGAAIWLALEVKGVVNIISFDPPVEPSDFAQIVGGIGSLVLTFGLVFLYKQQTTIQHRQERWMSASHRLELEFTGWEAEDNELSFELSNLGNGVAKNLAVAVTISEYPPRSYASNEISTVAPLYRENPVARSLEEGNSESREFVSDPIPEFQGTLFENGIQGKFHEIVQRFKENDIETVSFTITVEYDLIREESDDICVWDGTADIEDGLYLDDAIEKSTPDWEEIDIEITPENI